MFAAAQELGLPIDEKMYTNMLSLYGKAGQVLLPCAKKTIRALLIDLFHPPPTSVSSYPVLSLWIFHVFRQASRGVFDVQKNEGRWHQTWKGTLSLSRNSRSENKECCSSTTLTI